MDGEEEEENGHRYAQMEGKTDGGGGRDIEEAVRDTQEPINHHTYWIWKTSELMMLVCEMCVCLWLGVRRTRCAWTESILTCLMWLKSDPRTTRSNKHRTE